MESVSQISNKPSNVRRTVSRALVKNENNSGKIFEKLYVTSKYVPPLSFENEGVSVTTLRLIIDGTSVASFDVEKMCLTNELIVDFLEAKNRLNASWVDLKNWMRFLCVGGNECIFEESLRSAVLTVKDRCIELRKHQQTSEVQNFLSKSFSIPQPLYRKRVDSIVESTPDSEDLGTQGNKQCRIIISLLEKINSSESRIEFFIEKVNEEQLEKSETTEYMKILRKDLLIPIGDKSAKDSLLGESIKKHNEPIVKNINRRFKRTEQRFSSRTAMQEEVLIDLSCEVLEKSEEMQGKDTVNDDLQTKFEVSLKETLCAQELKWYYKNKAIGKYDEDVESSSMFDF